MYTTKNGRHGADLFPQIDRVLNEIFNTTIGHATDEKKNKYSQPSANIKEFKDKFEIYLAVPGLNREDLKLKLDKNILTVSSEIESEQDASFKLKEYNYGQFARKFKLPLTVDASTLEAKLENGILTISIMKKADEVDNGPKEISVK